MLITALFNVPMNNRLDAVLPNTPTSNAIWQTYTTRWTLWNHVRTLTSVLAMASLSFGLSI